MPLRTINGKLLKLDGSPWANGKVEFRLITPFVTANELFPAYSHTEVCDLQGEFVITIGVPETGTVMYIVITPDANVYQLNIGDGAPIDFEELIMLHTETGDQENTIAIINALTKFNIITITTDYTIDGTYDYIRCNGTLNLTLPLATGSGKVYLVRTGITGTVTVVTSGTDTVNELVPNEIISESFIFYIDHAVGDYDSNN